MVMEPHVSTSLLPSQQQLLLRVQHLSGLDSNLVIVAGRKGAGKHTIASAMLEQYSDGFDLAWLPLSGKQTDAQLREQILTQLYPGADCDAKLPLLQSAADMLGEEGVRQMIVINHAELLSNQMLVELWGLIENSRKLPAGLHHISILLFAEPSWANSVSREMATITEADQPVLQIPPLPLDERQLLFSNLQQRVDGDSMSVDLLERKLDSQEGLPGEVVDLFNRQSAQESVEETKETREPKQKNQLALLIGSGGAIVVLVALILFWADSDSSAELPQQTEAVKTEVSQEESQLPQFGLPDSGSEVVSEAPLNQSENITEATEVLPSPILVETQETEVDAESGKVRVELDEETLNKLNHQPGLEAGAELSQELKSEDVEPDSEINNSTQSVVPSSSATIEESKAQKVAPKVEAVPVSQSSERLEAAPITQPEQQQQRKKSKPTSWWETADSNHYVLQLAVMSKRDSLRSLSTKLGLENDPLFRQYAFTRNGKTLYAGVYGDYPSQKGALSARNELAAKIQALKPWPKPIQKIQQEAVNIE